MKMAVAQERSKAKMGRWLVAMAAMAAVAGTTSMAHAVDGLIHQYSFATDASDSVGTLAGTVNGGVTFTGGAAVFNGVAGSFLSFGSNDIAATSTGGLTLEYWAKLNWNGDGSPLYSIGLDNTSRITHWSGNGQHLFVNAGGKSATIDNWGLTGPAAFTNYGANYVHFADVFDQATNTMKVYVNGVLYTSASLGGVSLSNLSSSIFNIGGPFTTTTNNNDYIKGSISEFRIFNKALDPTTLYAYNTAGPDSIPTIYDLHSVANTDWTVNTTWAGSTPPAAGTPDTATVVNVIGNTVTLNGASGSALGLTVGAGGTLALTGGTLTVGATLDTSAGVLSLDGTSVLNTANINNASLAGVTVATGAAINVNGTLSLTSALPALTGANLSVKGLSVIGTSFNTANVNSFSLNGPISVSSNGTATISGGSQTATSIAVDGNQSALNVNGSLTTLAINGTINSLTSSGKLVVTDAKVTAKAGFDIGHDGTIGSVVVQGTGTLTSSAEFMTGRNTGAGSLIVKDHGVLAGGTNTLRLGRDNIRTNYARFQDNAVATFGNVVVFDSSLYGEGGQGSGSVLVVSDNAQLTTGAMTIANYLGNNNTLHPRYGSAQVYQSGGTVTVNGKISMGVTMFNAADVLVGTYNLNGGVLKAQQINTGTPATGGISGTANVNFHGGTLTYNGTTAQTDFINLGTNGSLYIYEGATIDSNGQNVTINQTLLSPNTGAGLAPITLATPIGAVNAFGVTPGVLVTGGGGTGATAVAVLNASGQVSNIIVTNPGYGYTSAPTVSVFYQGTATAVPAGSIALNAGNAFTGGLTKAGVGTLTLTSTSNVVNALKVTGGALDIEGKLTLATTAAARQTPDVAAEISADGLVLGSAAVLDITNHDMIVHYAPGNGAATLAAITSQISSGKITSSALASGFSLGYADNAALTTPYTSFDGISLADTNEVLVKYTYTGDANLDGKVTFADFQALLAGYGNAGSWATGDFNGNGTTTFADFQQLLANYGAGSSSPLAPVGAGVPEPASLGLLAVGALGLLARKRK